MADQRELPKGWEWKRLGEIAPITGRSVQPSQWPEKEFKYLSLENIEAHTGRLIGFTPTKGQQVKSTTVSFGPQHVLYGKLRPYLNKVFVPDFEGVATTEFLPLEPDQRIIIREFLAWYLRSHEFVRFASTHQTGSRMPRVNMRDFKAAEIPLPPLDEQQRIVARIEELTRRIEEAKGLRRAARDEAAALLPAALHEVFSQAEKEGWEWKRLGELVARTETQDPSRMPEGEFMYVDIASVDSTSGTITTLKILKGKDAPSRARKVIRANDVIFATTRPYLKSIALVPANLDNQICSTGFCVLRAVSSQVLSSWLFHLCRSDTVLNQVVPRMRGANYPAVTDKDILDAEIPVPPLDEQRRLVAYLDGLQAKVEALRRLQDETQAELDAMTAAVLDRAFQGEL